MSELERRKYWTRMMDRAYDFMQQASDVSICDCMENFASLPQAAEEAGVPVSFSQKPHVDNLPRLFYLREGLIQKFLAIAADLASRGWVLHVEDAYRTPEMQRKLAHQPYIYDAILERCRWEMQGAAVTPELLFKRVAGLVASWPKVAPHLSGSAMDISVYHQAEGWQVDRGADYVEMSELSPMDSPFVSAEAQRNRQEIRTIFAEHGFSAYPYEFWHFDCGNIFAMTVNDTAPAQYGAVDWDPETNMITPLAGDLLAPLNSPEKLMELIR